MAGLDSPVAVAGSGVRPAVVVAVSRDEKAPLRQMIAVWASLILASLLVWLVVVGGVRLVMDWAMS